jgi:hypothetical protein
MKESNKILDQHTIFGFNFTWREKKHIRIIKFADLDEILLTVTNCRQTALFPFLHETTAVCYSYCGTKRAESWWLQIHPAPSGRASSGKGR